MALTKAKKHEIVSDLNELLEGSRLTVVVEYKGTTVKDIQTLRKEAKANGTKLSVVKNRLVKKALESNDKLKGVDTSLLNGQLMYAFNSEDEVAPAQVLNDFAKTHPNIQFVGAITTDGKFMSPEEVKTLAALPGKTQLIAEVIAMLQSPLNDVTNALSGNLHALLDGVEAKATA